MQRGAGRSRPLRIRQRSEREKLRYLQDEHEGFEQEVQPPPCDGVNFPPLLEPKTENFFVTFLPPHEGHDTLIEAPPTSRSNSRPQRLQTNSKIGTGAPS